jgi:hypothetical protein
VRKRCRKSGRKGARLEGWGGGTPSCFETAARSATSGEFGRPHPEERACWKMPRSSDGRARVSKDEDGPSCFETAASPPPQHEGGESVAQPNAFTIARVGGRAKPELWLFPVFVLFRPVTGGKASRGAHFRF